VIVPTFYLAAAALVFGLVVGGSAGWAVQGVRKDALIANERADNASRAVKAVEEVRAVERARVATIGAIANEADQKTLVARRHAAAADDVAVRLRGHVARLAAACAGPADPAAPAASAPAAGPGLVLANLYRSADEEARELAASFDAARRAGLTCERVYESLTPP